MASVGAHRTSGWIELWSLNGGQDGLCRRSGVRYVRYVCYTPLALGLWVFWGRAPMFFVFCFPLPPTTPDTPGPYAAVLSGRLKTFGLDHKPGKKVSFLGVKKSHSYSYRIIAAAKRSIVAGVRSEKLRVTVRGGALAS